MIMAGGMELVQQREEEDLLSTTRPNLLAPNLGITKGRVLKNIMEMIGRKLMDQEMENSWMGLLRMLLKSLNSYSVNSLLT